MEIRECLDEGLYWKLRTLKVDAMKEFYGLKVDRNCGINGWAADAAFAHEFNHNKVLRSKNDGVNMWLYSRTIRQVYSINSIWLTKDTNHVNTMRCATQTRKCSFHWWRQCGMWCGTFKVMLYIHQWVSQVVGKNVCGYSQHDHCEYGNRCEHDAYWIGGKLLVNGE